MPGKSKYKLVRKKTKTYNVSAMKVAKKALKQSYGELKYVEDDIDQSIGTGLTFNRVTDIVQGISSLQRIGLTLKIKSFYIRGFVNVQTTNSNLSNTVRVFLVLDKQPNGNQFNAGDLLQDATDLFSMIKRGAGRRFKVYIDRMITVCTNGESTRHFKYYKKLNIPVLYDGITGSINDQETNALYWCMIADDEVNQVQLGAKIRVRFSDK